MIWTQRYFVPADFQLVPLWLTLLSTNADRWRSARGRRFRPGQVLITAVSGTLTRSGRLRLDVAFLTPVPNTWAFWTRIDVYRRCNFSSLLRSLRCSTRL